MYIRDKESNNNKKQRSGFYYFVAGLIGALIGGLIMTAIAPYFIYGKLLPTKQSLKDKALNESLSQITIDDSLNSNTTTSNVAKKVMPSVVGIATTTIERDDLGFGKAIQGVGSGAIVHKDGYILTNSHVVTENPQKILIYLMDGKELRGQVLWQDTILDLAVVKVEGEELPVAELGDSDDLVIGETAIAIGNPLGLRYERTVTQGIVSGLNRSIWTSNTELMEDLIQTDAAINPGNSGGPLLNSRGQIIGINTVKAATAEGLGFAIPINISKPIVTSFIETGRFLPTYIGIKLLDSEFASIFYPNIELKKSILVTDVVPQSPADRAGLMEQDIITHVDNVEVNTLIKFKSLLYSHTPGEKALVRYVRNDKVYEVEVTLQAQPKE